MVAEIAERVRIPGGATAVTVAGPAGAVVYRFSGDTPLILLILGVLFALHDDNLQRTTDVATKFPERKDSPANAFTMAELKTLDAGSWYNAKYPDRARPSYVGLKILTLDEIIDIAQANPKHKPGLYIETKEPKLFPGIEHDLKEKLQARGWLVPAGATVARSDTASGTAVMTRPTSSMMRSHWFR